MRDSRAKQRNWKDEDEEDDEEEEDEDDEEEVATEVVKDDRDVNSGFRYVDIL